MKKILVFGLLAAVLGFSSCSKDDDDVKDVPVASITLSTSSAELIIGGEAEKATITLIATVAPVNATEKSVIWTSSDEAVATVSTEGVVTAVAKGTATIKATAKDGSGKTASCTVTVTKAIPVTTGTAKAKINGSDVDVKWVQLWEGGPKFADRNVAGTMTFAEATKEGSDYVWGANWRTPSKDEMNELLRAVDSNSTKIKCEYVNDGGNYVFKFTGLETYYTENTLILPIESGNYSFCNAYYWSSTEPYYYMYLRYDNEAWDNWWFYGKGERDCFVRPVLKN